MKNKLQTMRKMLAIFLALVCALSIVACGGNDNSGKVSEGLEFTSNGDGTCSLSGMGDCKDTNIVIPSTSPDGDKVTAISQGAFQFYSSIKSITIPEGVTSIGATAFSYCSGLKSINIPKGVTAIHMSTFFDCSSLTDVYYSGTPGQFGQMFIYDSTNKDLTSATVHFYTETEPTESGNYWHYVDGVPTKW